MSRFPFDVGPWLLVVCCGCLVADAAQSPESTSSQPGPPSVQNQAPTVPSDHSQHSFPDSELWTPDSSLHGVRTAAGPTGPIPQPTPPLWVSSSQSAGQRPIEVARLGNGPRTLLIIGSLDGNDRESIELMDATVQLARSVQTPPHLTVFLIRSANPDGMAEHTRTNAHGVDLNRNFPSQNFTSAPSRVTGPCPASEVETQYLVNLIKQQQPARVIHVRSSLGERPQVLVNESWPEWRNSVPDDVAVSRFQTNHKAGSLEEFVSDLKLPLATVQLPPKGFRQLQAAELLRFASAYVSSSGLKDESASAPKRSHPSAPVTLGPIQADGEKGMVEFLPPPPEYAPTSTAERTNSTPNPRYEELAPPPRN